VREAKAQESVREAKEEAENLRKIETKELKAFDTISLTE
jgi:hypothetical protein